MALENTEQYFLSFPKDFLSLNSAKVKPLPNNPRFLTTLRNTAFENTVGKEHNAMKGKFNGVQHRKGVLGSSRTGSSGVCFMGMSLGKTLQSLSVVPVKPRKDINNVNCHRKMTEILLKAS